MTTRRLPSSGLERALAEAQAEFAASGAGHSETWILPPGRHRMLEPLRLGAADRELILRGRGVNLDFEAAVLAAEDAALALSGAKVAVEGMRIAGVAGSRVAALDLAATLSARVEEVEIVEVRGDDAAGLRAAAPELVVEGITVDGVGGTEASVGMTLSECRSMTLAACRKSK